MTRTVARHLAATKGPDGPEVRTWQRVLTDPAVLPSDTSIRFAILVALVLASTASIYEHLALGTMPRAEQSIRGCLSGEQLRDIAGVSLENAQQMRGSALLALGCARPFTPALALWALAGTVLVALATIALHAATPWWKIHFPRPWRPWSIDRSGHVRYAEPWWRLGPQSLRPLDELLERYAWLREVDEYLDELVSRVGLANRPTFLVDTYRYTAEAAAFGRGRRGYVRLDIGLLWQFRNNRSRFSAVVLHELGHLHNRDTAPTSLAYASWRAFLALAAAPYAVAVMSPRVFTDFRSWRPSDIRPSIPDPQATMAVLTLIALVYLTRTAVLRVRETHADAVAAQHGGYADLRAAIAEDRSRLRWFTVLSCHPTTGQRLVAMDDPASLYSSSRAQMFAAGVVIAVINTTVTQWLWVGIVASRLGRGLPPFVAVTVVLSAGALLAIAMTAGLASVTMWRARLRAVVDGTPVPVLRLGVPVAAGILVGEPMSIIYANAGAWGVFDGVGRAGVAGSLISAAMLVAVVLALFRWASESAAVWLPVVDRSLRRACVATTVVALGYTPLFVGWLLFHDQASIAMITRWTPQVAFQLRSPYWPGPGTAWLQAKYLPTELLGALPGVGLLIVLPCLLVALGALRRTPATKPVWLGRAIAHTGIAHTADAHTPDAGRPSRPHAPVGTAMVAGLLGAAGFLGVGFAFALALRHSVGGAQVRHAAVGALPYLVAASVVVMAICASVAAVFAATREPALAGTLGMLSASVTVAVSSALAPGLILVGVCGPSGAIQCASRVPDAYAVLYGGVSLPAPLNASLLAALCCVLPAIAARLLAPATPERRTGPTRPYREPSRTVRIAGRAMVALVFASMIAATYYGVVLELP